MSRRDTDPNRGNRRVPLSSFGSVADQMGLNDDAQPREAGPTDADRKTAREVIRSYFVVSGMEWDELTDLFAAALADERRRVVEPFKKLAARIDAAHVPMPDSDIADEIRALIVVAGRAGSGEAT